MGSKSGSGKEDPGKDLDEYQGVDRSLVRGGVMSSINGFHIYGDWKMNIKYPETGYIQYYVYKNYDQGNIPIYVPLGYAEREIHESFERANNTGLAAGVAVVGAIAASVVGAIEATTVSV
ncbi:MULTISPECIES: hypothetical protein [unclassified Paenibacillus]|uniref:hypothetical protein n=1 Tax=unclassified Paenibacillus TaxID=185978 RepID=UPI0036309A9F